MGHAPGGSAGRWSDRLCAVRGLARHLHGIDSSVEVPPVELIAWRQRRIPYLYSPSDITRLVGAAASLPPALRGATYEALFGLLSCTGMRVGETIALDRGDVDLTRASWRSPMPSSVNIAGSRCTRAVAALRHYAEVRDRLCPRPKVPSFFVSTRGTRLLYVCVNEVFRKLVEDTGLAAQPGAGRPRIHDLRHGFATASVQDFHRSGADPEGKLPRALGLPRPCRSRLHLHLPPCLSGAARIGGKTARALRRRPTMSALAPTVQAWFTEHLLTQRQASPRTVGAYRDTLRMLLAFAQARTGKAPSQLDVADLDATLIGAFLTHLEQDRHNSARTRNARLAAIRSLYRYAALRHPEHAQLIQRVLAIPGKRHDRSDVSFLQPEEVDALLAAPDRSTRIGRRDHALLVLAVQTGLRVSELTGLGSGDIQLGSGPHVRCTGKGRKDRATPLTAHTVTVLREWMKERAASSADPLFVTSRGGPLSPDAVQWLVAKYAVTAAKQCPSIAAKTVSPHALRHTCAMNLLHSGVDVAVIALWLGHESTQTTSAIYLHADMSLKEQALARTTPPNTRPGRYRPRDALLAFLEGL